MAAGVTEATARAVVRSGVLGDLPRNGLTLGQVLALKVAATVSGLVFPGELRPANVIRDALPREREAASLAVDLADAPVDPAVVMLVYPHEAVAAHTPAELAARVLLPATTAYLVLPVGQWLAELSAPLDVGASA